MKLTPNHQLQYVEGDDKPADYPLVSQTNMERLDTLLTLLFSDKADAAEIALALAGKANSSHNHDQSDINGLATALAGKANSSHTHTMGQVTGLDTALAGKAAASHTHTMGQVTGLDTALAGKAPTSHTHTMGQVTGLDTALAGKAAASTLDARVPSALALRLDTTVGTRVFAGNTMIHGDTGLRAMALWGTDGTLSYGEFPTGLTFNPGSGGGIWLRRVNDMVSLYISGARLSVTHPTMRNVPVGFYPSGGPYPSVRMSSSTGQLSIRVGGGTLFLSGTAGEDIPVTSGSYIGFTQWQVASSWPTALPGIPG